MDLVDTNSKAAAGIWKRITKRVARDLIDQKKLSDFQSFIGIEEDVLFIENKFSIKEKKKIMNLLEKDTTNPQKQPS